MTNATSPTRPQAAAEHPQPATMPALTIPSRFCGPPGSGNGGYVCGRIAAYLDGQVTVTLRRPPPLATPLAVERGGESSVRIHHGRTLVAEAASSPGSPALEIPGPVSLAEARTAAGRARYYSDPFFPACFVCGPEREPGDGLRIFPGPVAGRVVWAAPDCPSGIAAAEAADLTQDTAILLGRMTASLAVLPAAGDQYRVIAWPGERDGRKLTAGSALLGPGGQVLAAARAVWLTVQRPVLALAAEGAS